MTHDELGPAIGKIFSLKSILFNTFDIAPLDLGINRTQERVLMMCHHQPNAQMSFLSREAGLEKGSFTSVIDSLERAGLVERARDETDGRAVTVRTTTEGTLIATRIAALFRAHVDDTLDKLDPHDRSRFERAMIELAGLIPLLTTQGENK
jgi:DNA-binding MarR family transcriptional regulator